MVVRLLVEWVDLYDNKQKEWFEKQWSCNIHFKLLHKLMRYWVYRQISSRKILITNIKELQIEYVRSE